MEINITFFVQMIHFFVAWFIIKKLLLQPTLHAIKLDNDSVSEQKLTILSLNNHIISMENKKQNEFSLYQQQFKANMPLLLKENNLFVFRNISTSINTKPIDLQSVPQQKELLEKKLIAKLGSINE